MNYKELFKKIENVSVYLDFGDESRINIEDLFQAFKARLAEENEIVPKILRVSEDDNLFIVSPSLPNDYEIIVRKKR